jgi:hypothetical protein
MYNARPSGHYFPLLEIIGVSALAGRGFDRYNRASN